jgi:cytochrome c biogenesis protein CcdA
MMMRKAGNTTTTRRRRTTLDWFFGLLVWSCCCSVLDGFQPAALSSSSFPATTTRTRTINGSGGSSSSRRLVRPAASYSRSTTRRLMTNINFNWETAWENFLYEASNAASGLAASSLNHPADSSQFFLPDHQHGAAATAGIDGAIPVLYLAGLLTSFSPCVWGLLPVTMSYISQATKDRSDQNALYPTVAFAVGLTTVFCGLGVAATTVGGAVLGGSGDSGNTMGIFSNAICLLMGLRILELIQLPLPSLNFVRDAVLQNNHQSPQSGPNKMNRIMMMISGRGGRETTSTEAQASSYMPQQQPFQPILIDATGQILKSTTTSTTTCATATATMETDEWSSLFRTFLLGGSSALAASPCTCFKNMCFVASLRVGIILFGPFSKLTDH